MSFGENYQKIGYLYISSCLQLNIPTISSLGWECTQNQAESSEEQQKIHTKKLWKQPQTNNKNNINLFIPVAIEIQRWAIKIVACEKDLFAITAEWSTKDEGITIWYNYYYCCSGNYKKKRKKKTPAKDIIILMGEYIQRNCFVIASQRQTWPSSTSLAGEYCRTLMCQMKCEPEATNTNV